MHGFRRSAYVSAIIWALSATSVFAAMSAPKGWYMDINAGSSNLSGKSYPGKASSAGIGGSGTVGYKFMPYFGAEAGYTIYGNTDIDDTSTNTTAGFDRHYSYDLALKGIFPVQQSGFELFGKLGIGQVKSSIGIDNQTAANNLLLGANSHTATGVYLAGGGQYYFSSTMAVNAQYAYAKGNSSTGNPSLISAGLSLLFG